MKTNAPGIYGNLLLVGLLGVAATGPALGQPAPISVDARAVTGSNSNVNGIFEPGETVQLDPTWTNTSGDPLSVTGTASNLTGLEGPTYSISDASANYGTVSPGATADCDGATSDCYLMTVAGTRPATHWDAVLTENLSSDPTPRYWTIHVGNSFTDVPIADPFYPFIETILHNGVTAGCNAPGAPPAYCMNDSVSRAQIAVFLLKGKFGSSHVPPHAMGTVFGDVHVGDFAAAWIEELAGLGITSGCGNGNYCPNDPITRAQMAVLLLRSEHGSAYVPAACTGLFADVPCPSTEDFPYSDWIEQLSIEGITAGCSPAPPGGLPGYCPADPVTRGEMAVFLVRAYGLVLYGPSRSPQALTVTWSRTFACIGAGSFNKNWGFSPSTIHVHAGDTVNWVWPSGGGFPPVPPADNFHSTTAYAGYPDSWDSGEHTVPYSFSHTFAQPGSFPYSCSHGHTFWEQVCYLRCSCQPSTTHEEAGTVIVDP